ESHDGPTNNTPATGQSINASLLPLPKTARRGAVLGQTDASTSTSTVFLADFESGTNAFVVGSESNNLWHRSTGRGAQSGPSTTSSFYCGKGEGPSGGGSYNNTTSPGGTRSQGTNTSPSIALPAGQLSLDFNYVLQTQGSTGADLAVLEIKRSTSSTWTTLAS